MSCKVFLQYGDLIVEAETLAKNAEDYLRYDRDMPPIDQVDVALYVKPEENKVYVVVGDTEEGSFLL